MEVEDRIDVRVITPHEWRMAKAIRLEALMDTPSAFVTSHDEAAAYPDSLWMERAEAGAKGDDQLTVLAFDGTTPVGLSVGLLKAEGTVLVVVSVFVSPGWRGRGIADRMFEILEQWGSDAGADRAGLWVEETNERARGLYRRLGYGLTPDRQRIPNDSGLWEVRLEKRLTRSD